MNRLFHGFLYVLGTLLVRLGLRVERYGDHHVPSRGPVIVAANHVSMADPVILGIICRRPLRFMMTAKHFDIPWATWFFRAVGTIRVAREGSNRAAIAAALRALHNGEAIGIFPEGGIQRHGDFGEARTGLAMLALKTGAPVVPALLRGTREFHPPDRLEFHPARMDVRFGPPLHLDRAAVPNRKALNVWADGVLARIREMAP